MKHFVQILLLAIVLESDYTYGDSLIPLCLSAEEKESETPVENENNADKPNRSISRDISINLNNKKIKSYIKYLNNDAKSTNWALETITKNDPFVRVWYNGIKNSKDTRPITWQHWEIKAKSAGFSTLVLRKFVDDKQVEAEKIKVTVIES